MKEQKPILILIGPPGCGKGTQGDVIAKALNIPKVSTGDLLRGELQSGTERGEKLKAIMGSGALVDDNIVLALLKEKISQKECENGFILDGFPRNVLQADELEKSLSKLDKVFKFIAIDVAVPDKKIIDRIVNRYYCKKCKTNYNKLYKNPIKENICDVCGERDKFAVRADDKANIVARRLKEYEKQTAPLLSYYKTKEVLFKVDGDQQIDRVTHDINSKLKKILTY
jgi:adenylate kinase